MSLADQMAQTLRIINVGEAGKPALKRLVGMQYHARDFEPAIGGIGKDCGVDFPQLRLTQFGGKQLLFGGESIVGDGNLFIHNPVEDTSLVTQFEGLILEAMQVEGNDWLRVSGRRMVVYVIIRFLRICFAAC